MTVEPLTDTFELAVEARGVPRGRAMLERAEWASRAFARYDLATVRRIVVAAAEAGAAHAAEFAERAVSETGFGVVEHKVIKNLACSTGLLDTYRDHDYVSVRLDVAGKIVEVPRPAGVVLALTPSTNPVATVYFKTVLALMTRNAVVITVFFSLFDFITDCLFVDRPGAPRAPRSLAPPSFSSSPPSP